MVKLDYDAIIKAGDNHGACGIMEWVRNFVDKGETEHANAIIADCIGWIQRKILQEEHKLFPKEFIDAMKLNYPYRRFAAAKALGSNHTMTLMLRDTGVDLKPCVSTMEIEIDENYFSVNVFRYDRWFLARILVWNDLNEAWSVGVRLEERLSLKTVADPSKAKKAFIKLIRKHKAEICAQLG